MHNDPALVNSGVRFNGALIAGLAARILAWLRRPLSRGRGLALLLVLALALVFKWNPLPVEIMRLKTFDLMQRLLPVDTTPPVVTVVAIDEKSLDVFGQWPWSRKLLSKLVVDLTKAGAAVIGFDIVFAEPDRMSPAALADEIANIDPASVAQLKKLPTNDDIFARTIAHSRVVLGRFSDNKSEEDDQSIVRKATFATIGPDPRGILYDIGKLVPNLSELENAAAGIGFLELLPEHDNIVRRVPTLVRLGDRILPSLSIEMLRVATGQKTVAIKTDVAGMKSLVLAGVEVPVDAQGRMWLRALRKRPERYVSAADLLAGRVDPAKIRGRPILVGATAAGLQDLRSTSLEKNLPGVEVHAHLIENILAQKYLERPAMLPRFELLSVVVVGLLLIAVLPMIGARWTLLALATVGVGLFLGAYYLLKERLLLADPSYPVASAAVIYTFLVYSSYVSEERQRLYIRNAFSQYLSPALVERLASNPGSLKLGGDTRQMTFLFCDVRGFTSISEGFKSDPQGLTRLINRFLTPMTDIIMDRRGTIDKYMGDCIMAFWNAPIDDPEHARHACVSALSMMAELEQVNRELEREAAEAGRRFAPLRIGIGLNTGECVVGNMGSEQRFDYSVLGDAVNLASRLEGQSKTYGVDIIIGEDTQVAAPEFAALELDLIAVKGKAEAVRIFALLGDHTVTESEEFKRLCARQGELLAAYRAQDWDRAEALLEECRALGDRFEGLYDLFAERVAFFRQNPPGEDWDGVFVAETK